MKSKHTTKNHAEIQDGEAGNSKGTKGGGSAEPQGETRRDGARVLAVRTRNKPGPRSSKRIQDLPIPDSDWSDTEVEEREDDVSDTDSEVSSTSSVDHITGKRKKRGRPPTTFEGIKKKKREQVKRGIRLLKAEKKALEEVANPKVAPRSATPEKETIRRMETLSQEEMAAEMLENINVVVKVAERSSNLKGMYVRDLKASSATLRAAATVVATKPAGPNSAASEEIERWKERVRSLEDQVAKLTALLQEERAARIAAEKKAEETATVRETDMVEEMPEVVMEVPDVRQEANHSSQASTRAQDQGRTTRLANQRKPKAQGRKQEAGIRRVMEGVSIKEVVCGDSDKVKRNLENLITRCQGALSRIPTGKGETGKRLPVVTSVDEMKNKPTTSWAEVVRKGRKKPEKKEPNPVAKTGKPATTATINGAEKKGQKEQPKRRLPKTAAVAISFPEGQAAEGMRFLRSQIKLEDLGIDKVKSRKALNGATLLEISGGAEAKVRADALATTIKTVGEGKGVKVTRPEKRAEIRIKDLDESVSEEEIRAAVTKAGGGLPDDVKVGPIRRTPGGMGTCWIQCGLEVARRTAEAKRIRLGWVLCRVELLDPRPLVCFRCLERGHIRAQCRSSTDRSMLCYRCGKEGHKAQGCTETPDCAVCKGRPQGWRGGVSTPEQKREEEGSQKDLAERGCGLGIVAEPYRVPKNPCWAGSTDGSAAIVWRRTGEQAPPFSRLKAGEGWVAVKWGPLFVIGVYLRPSLTRAEADARLEELEDLVREYLPGPILVAGDFNAKSALWGSRRPDAKGADVEAWAARLGLHLENVGSVSTCVRPQGESIVDLTWTSPAAARRISGWEVAEGLELLSDHLPIHIKFTWENERRSLQQRMVRWRADKLDPDKLKESLIAALWAQPDPAPTVEEEARWVQRVLIDALRKSSVAARRAVLRARRRRGTPPAEEERLVEEYRQRRKALRAAIRTAKEKAWEELISSLNEDPWGRPYKLVMNKLSSGAPPTVENLDPRFLQEVVEALFPAGDDGGPPPRDAEHGEEHQPWQEELGITRTELARAAKKLKKGKAPGPDGVPGIILKAALGELSDRLEGLYTRCLEGGIFPGLWKKARLVLLPKEDVEEVTLTEQSLSIAVQCDLLNNKENSAPQVEKRDAETNTEHISNNVLRIVGGRGKDGEEKRGW
ncbi:PREDICTED: uncharacterized protein LOC105557921 [Vollenhovia emeryi]|uniref:uncharacterized protein LOC105557921 n=1 Tax=Vollenhovia emeryi TaxID=411798 RepID=UPI0005F57A10|nr:PREDICTED: uncharacterized protein LOC105557921 [Vollenhovia emeryi]